MKNYWITYFLLLFASIITLCRLTCAKEVGDQLFPIINYNDQSPMGTHKLSISHRDIDEKKLAENHVDIRNILAGLVSRRILNRFSDTSIQRDLGDFDDLNNLLKGVTLSLPDINQIDAGKYLFSTLYIWARDIVCSDVTLGNMVINHGMKNDQEYDFSLNIEDLGIACDMNWRYEYSFFSGEGTAQVYTTKSDASITLQLKSTNFSTHPPSDVEATDCATTLEIDNLDLQGGIVASIAGLFEDALTNAIEGAINDVACGELNSIGEDMLKAVINSLAELLEDYLPENLPPVDYLLPERNMTVPDDMELLNFSTLGSESGNWFELALELVDNVLGVGPNSTDFNINQLLRNTILSDDGILEIPLAVEIFDGHDMLTETLIELINVRIVGLDTINRFDSLGIAGNHTLFNHFSWEHVDVEMDFNLTIKPSSTNESIIGGPGQVVKEHMTITAGINDIDVDFHLLLAVDKNKVGGMHLGSLTNASNIMPCVVETIHLLEVVGFAVDARSIDIPTLSGFISTGIDRVVTNTANAVFNMYEPILTKAMPNTFQLVIKDVLNDLIQASLSGVESSCAIKSFPTNNTFLNFPDLLLNEEESMVVGGTGASQYGHMIRDIMILVKEEVLKIESDGRSIFNEMLISRLTETQSGTAGSIKISNDFGAAMTLEIIDFVADLEIKVSNVSINHLDSIGVPLNILDPVAAQTINNTLGFGVGPNPLQGSMILTVGFTDGVDINLRNVLDVRVDIQGAVDAAAHLSIIENAFMNFPVEDMLNINCWISMMPAPILDSRGVRVPNSESSMRLEDLALVMSKLNLKVNCIDCSSPLLEELAPLLSSDGAINEITDSMNGVLNYVTNLLGGTYLQVQLDRLLAEAPLQCPHSVSYDGSGDIIAGGYESFTHVKQPSDSITFIFVVAGVVGGTMAIIVIAYTIIKAMKSRREGFYIKELSEHEIASVSIKHQREIKMQRQLNSDTVAMFKSTSIPFIIRIFIPLVILANMGFFLSGHLSLGASVDLEVQLAGERVSVDKLFLFSMAESISDMWEAGAKELAIMVLLFSGVWPYSKQCAMLILWFAPPRLISVNMREKILVWLDRLGKWSFVDIFVLILSLSSFRVSVKTPDDLAYLPQDFFKLNLIVTPCWGLYSNMIAQLISQVNSHYVIHFHRKIKFDHEKKLTNDEIAKENDDPTPLYKHSFKTMFAETTLHVRPFASITLIFLAILFVGLIISGCVTPSYSLEQFGLVGLSSSKSYVEHDIFSTVKLLVDQASFTGSFTDRIGLTVLSSILVLTVLIVPMVQLALSLYRWFYPMTKKTRFHVFIAIEALSAWQYIEVYLLSIIVASWQLGGVSEMLINDYCNGLEDTFAMLQYYGILGVNESQCFRVSARLQPATWILIASSIVFALINHIINSAATQQEEDLKVSSFFSDSIDFIVPDNIGSESGKIQKLKFNQLRRLEPVRFQDWYPCFLQKGSNSRNAGEYDMSEPRISSTIHTDVFPISPKL